MVKNIFKIAVIVFALSAVYQLQAVYVGALSPKSDRTIIVSKTTKQSKHTQKKAVIPTIILGFFTFALVFLVFFVRSRVAKEIKRRQIK